MTISEVSAGILTALCGALSQFVRDEPEEKAGKKNDKYRLDYHNASVKSMGWWIFSVQSDKIVWEGH